jgi:hypothetical protein
LIHRQISREPVAGRRIEGSNEFGKVTWSADLERIDFNMYYFILELEEGKAKREKRSKRIHSNPLLSVSP